MRVLHLFSNSKWTGPAEPALRLCIGLRDAGVDVSFACQPQAKSGYNKVAETAREHGLDPISDLYLNKHHNPIQNKADEWKLAEILQSGRFNIVHCHLDNDHRIAARPAARASAALIRSSYFGDGFPEERGRDAILRRTQHILEPSELAKRNDMAAYGIAEEKLTVVPAAIDTHRFDPNRTLPDGRAALGIADDIFLIGIIARMQPQRHFDDLWNAFEKVVAAGVNAHIVVAGRGSKQEGVAREPVRARGLEDRVHFPGYIDGDDFAARVKAFDAKVYLVPGTDGTCRAVREALALGVPCVVSNRGMLPELVDDGATGFVTDGSPDALADALISLAKDDELRTRLSAQAASSARERFAIEPQVQKVLRVYESL